MTYIVVQVDTTQTYKALYDLKKSSLLCDVHLLDDTGKHTDAHACVLAAGSPVLKNALLLNQASSIIRRHGMDLMINGITIPVWEKLLQYFYLGKVSFNDLSLTVYLYEAAKMLGVTPLQEALSMNAESLGFDVEAVNIPSVNLTLAPSMTVSHKAVQTAQQQPLQEVVAIKSEFATQIRKGLPKDKTVIKTEATEIAEVIDFPEEVQTKNTSSFEKKHYKVICQYCSMGFEKKSSLVDHISDSCRHLNRSALNQEILSPYVHLCPESNCGATFDVRTQHLEWIEHLVGCIMTPESKLPVNDSIEQDGALFFLSNQVSNNVATALQANQVLLEDGQHAYSCTYCDFITNKIDMCEHLAIVHGDKAPYICKLCDVAFPKISALKEHFHSHMSTTSGLRRTPIKRIKLEEDSADETREVPSYKPLKCPNKLCMMEFTGRVASTLFADHLRSCIMSPECKNPSEYTISDGECLIYKDGNESYEAFRNHKLQKYECQHCNVVCAKERMAQHLVVVHGKLKPFVCGLCTASYGYCDTLVDHYISRHTEEKFQCNYCTSQYNKKDSLRRHILLTHKRDGRMVHECQICLKKFKYSSHARRHERFHLGKNDRRYICDICKKAFYTKYDLDRHFMIHTGLKEFACQFCSYTTNRKGNLIIHERKHGIIHGSYICITCDRYFMSHSRFQAHIDAKKHTGGHISQMTASQEDSKDIEFALNHGATDENPVVLIETQQ